MCGIFTYIGSARDAGKRVAQGLTRLEYRGYDSFGIAEATDDGIRVVKEVGKISAFDPKRLTAAAHLAMAHTRWATHGGVTQKNAHPHTSGDIAVVHNGIIENYIALKKELMEKGYRFTSQTDTEVIAHLLHYYRKKYSLDESVRRACARFTGRYAFVVMEAGNDTCIAARRGSPLIIGIRQPKKVGIQSEIAADAFFIASDVPAFLGETNVVAYLDDDEMVTASFATPSARAQFHSLKTGAPLKKRVITLTLAIEEAGKGEYRHFMLKEIMEQKDTIGRVATMETALLEKAAAMLRKSKAAYFLGCGTAGKVGHIASYFFSSIAGKRMDSIVGSEFALIEPFLTPQTVLVAISQSGETADILEAFTHAKKKKVQTVSLVNAPASSLARQSMLVLPVLAGPEKAVASTKATTAQMALTLLLAYATAGDTAEGQRVLRDTAAQINDLLNPRYAEYVAGIARKLRAAKDLFIIGRGADYPMALEASIKLMEVSYIHAQGFAAGELKHGPLALIEKGAWALAFVAPNGEARAETLSNIAEIKARGGSILGISPTADPAFDIWLKVPDSGSAQSIVNIIPVQLLSYYLAVHRKNNPDTPRNLAKSVTVK